VPEVPPTSVPSGHVAVGRIASPRGIEGDVNVIPLADSPAPLTPGRTVSITGHDYLIERARTARGALSLKLSGIDDREAAKALRGQLLTVPEDALEPLPEGQYYRYQLIGLHAVSTAGTDLGELVEVIATGSADVYLLRNRRGEALVPATDEAVKEVDLEGGRIVIEPLPGLIPDSYLAE
jgi:16S rRNA processing protein RimM